MRDVSLMRRVAMHKIIINAFSIARIRGLGFTVKLLYMSFQLLQFGNPG